MVIKSITIENFQSYYSPQTIEFSEGLNLIVGHGGKGKSKLFNAFYWVLFGKIYITGTGWCSTDGLPHSAKFAMQKYEFINAKALSEAQVGDRVKTLVRMELEDDKENIYKIERVVWAERLDSYNWNSTEAWQVGKSELSIVYDDYRAGGTKIVREGDAESKMSDLFPEGIRNYIWFQGESLDSLLNFRNKDTLKSPVKHISYYPYYEKLSTIILESKNNIEREEAKKLVTINKGNAELKKVLNEITFNKGKIEQKGEKKEKLEEEILKIETYIAQYEKGLEGKMEYHKLRIDLQNEEKKEKDILYEIQKKDEYQRKEVTDVWILRGISPILENCKEIINNHTKTTAVPPEIRYLDNPSKAKLEEILKDGQCFVCGSDASEGTKAADWIKNRLKEQEKYLQEFEDYKKNIESNRQFERFIGKIQDYPDDLLLPLQNIDKNYLDSEDEIVNKQNQRKKIIEKKREIEKAIDDLRKKGVDITGDPQVTIDDVKASRRNLESCKSKLTKLKNEIEEYTSNLNELEKKKAKLLAKIGGGDIPETKWKEISEFLEKICKKVQENARKELLHKIETKANEFYQKFTEHDKGYKGEVKINEDYSIEYDSGLNTSHEDRRKMSIINAMLSLNQEALEVYYPFISDAPTSSFDIPTTHKYLWGVKDIFGQSIIMTKDVELEGERFEELMKEAKVSRIYALESKIYGDDMQDPKLDEVSTIVKQLK
ncbi:chromosome segregation protein [Bergeyella porcorum]|uniref:Chromosome segregation protein n=1 Tax=Bergeyella porcorum TaxID=1735111 RepID=A0AAU0F1P6_9FLAO